MKMTFRWYQQVNDRVFLVQNQMAKFSDPQFLAGVSLPRPDLSTIPFVGTVVGEPPAAALITAEVRRGDVGVQRYGSGLVKQKASADRNDLASTSQPRSVEVFSTSIGPIQLQAPQQELGFMPSALAVDFLRERYLGSRQPALPQRYYPK